ncbi:hypothetical protein IJG14_00660 [bacterium]|nr:hypothetical protein [bacterium]
MALNKLQIRAKIMPILAELKNDAKLSLDIFMQKTEELREIEDKKTFFDILCKEMSKKNDDKYTDILRAMTLEFIPADMIEQSAMNIIQHSSEPDMLKYQLIQILKTMGKNIDYQEFYEYLDDATSIINYDTEKLLEHAVVNPETQIDFLDFLAALQNSDKSLLIDSLSSDYTGDNLANILAPVLYSDYPENILLQTTEILGETKSSLAIDALEFLHEVTDSDEIRTACKKSLNMLKLSGATKQKADNFYKRIMSESVPFKCYTGVPDGHYNQGFIFSRKRKDGSLMMFSLVVSKLYGIVDSFGFFNISEAEFERIALRFSKDEIRFSVSPEYCKMLLENALALTKSRKETMRYEFICWAMLMADISPMEQTEENFVMEKIEPIQLNKKIVNILYTTNYIDKWFFTVKDNENFKNLIDDFIAQKNLTFEYVEEKIKDSFDEIWNENTLKLLHNNIMTTCYLFVYIDFKDYAKILYSILFNEQLKKEMLEEIIKKSVYEYFFSIKQMNKEFKFPTNIFRKKEEQKKEIDIRTVDKIIASIEEKWVVEEI